MIIRATVHLLEDADWFAIYAGLVSISLQALLVSHKKIGHDGVNVATEASLDKLTSRWLVFFVPFSRLSAAFGGLFVLQ